MHFFEGLAIEETNLPLRNLLVGNNTFVLSKIDTPLIKFEDNP